VQEVVGELLEVGEEERERQREKEREEQQID
jgi:hypothetical protein